MQKQHSLAGSMLGDNADRHPSITHGNRSMATELEHRSRWAAHRWSGGVAPALSQPKRKQEKKK